MSSFEHYERQLNKLKCRELHSDYRTIMSMIEMNNKIKSTQVKTMIVMELIQQIGEIVCSIHFYTPRSKENIEKILPMKENVQKMMKNYKEWSQGWQSVWERLEDISHQ
tara:strand:- start:206 stop:532 length:327 start_codon:yes stop_codon:yes gene_type:complete